MFSHIEGNFNSTSVKQYQQLSINRALNTVDKVRHQHYVNNLQIMLLPLNHALGPAEPEEQDDWLEEFISSTIVEEFFAIIHSNIATTTIVL